MAAKYQRRAGIWLFVFLSALARIQGADLAHSGTFTSYGPQTYLRGSGNPATVVRNFTIPNPSTSYTLKIYNGGRGTRTGARVSSAVISLNGAAIVGPQNFNEKIGEISFPVKLASSNQLSVELRSQRGSLILVEIIGTDNAPPTLNITAPKGLVIMNGGATPQVSVQYSDATSGLDLSSLKILVDADRVKDEDDRQQDDGQNEDDHAQGESMDQGNDNQENRRERQRRSDSIDLTPTCKIGPSSATCPLPNLAAGTHTATAKIRDRAGNLATANSAFEIDNIPVANAGRDQTLFVGNTAQLDGSGSNDIDGDLLSFQWSFVSRPAGSQAALSDPSAVKPFFIIDKPGNYELQLIVSDGQVDSLPDNVIISMQNSKPVATAGADQTVSLGARAFLDGRGSHDVDGDPLTFRWRLVSKPLNSTASLDNATTSEPSIIADKPGSYTIELIVNDGFVDSDPDQVVITTENSRPIADAGPDLQANVGDLVQLDGSNSQDADNDPLTYHWSFTAKPDGSAAVLSIATIVNPTFVPDLPGLYVVQLIVSDGRADSKPDTASITNVVPPPPNRPPVAVNDSTLTAQNTAVTITVLGNDTDPDGDTLTIDSVTQGTNGAVTKTNTVVTYTPANGFHGTDSFTYTISDGHGHTASATVTVTVDQAPVVNAGADQVITLPASANLAGTVTDDGLPTPVNLTQSWTKVSGPGNVTFANASALATTASFSQAGVYVLRLTANDGFLSASDDVQITVNPAPPVNRNPLALNDSALTALNTAVQISVLSNDSDPDGDKISITQVGQGANGAVAHNGTTATYTPNNNFNGIDTFNYTIGDGRGGSANAMVTVTVDRAPQVNAGADQTITLPTNTTALAGVASDDGLPTPPGALTITWSAASGPAAVTFGNLNAAQTTATFTQAGTYVLRLTADDGFLSAFDEVQITVNPGGPPLPPDPSTVAPPLDLSVTSTIGQGTEFLYTGPNPIQTGVALGTIKPDRAAVIRGKVVQRSGAVLPGVTISILKHPEFGQTLSRADGMYDMAVNGGGPLTISYAAIGFLPAQRQVNVPAQDYVTVPNVALIPLDTQVTTINLNAGVMQFHRGNLMTDADGSRRATVMIPPGTTAQIFSTNGAPISVSSLNVRVTEYTVGANGPIAMPAALPPNSGYTYAFEVSADEATKKIAGRDVLLSQPVPIYVENFLNFPVGMRVPTGYYDSDRAAWVPINDGRVVKVLSISGGEATLDTDGDGISDGGLAIGVTAAERQQLATLYQPGQTLWRVPIPHFSTWDSNWGFRPNCNPQTQACKPVRPDPDPFPDDTCRQEGSIIECERQVLGEAVKATGTPFSLHYQSDRVPGYRAAFTRNIRLSDASIPDTVTRIDLEISFQGRLLAQSFPAAANQTHLFTWDGKDAYGRVVQGQQPVKIRVGYVYDGIYQAPAQVMASFGYNGNGDITGGRTRGEITIWTETNEFIGGWDASATGLGAWTLSPHHAYDSGGKILYLGDGRRRSAKGLASVINATKDLNNIDGSALIPYAIAVAPNGSVYIAGSRVRRIYRLDPDGTVTHIAGTGGFCFSLPCGDGGQATQALLNTPVAVSVGPDSSLYIAEGSRVRRVDPNGIITTVAGGGTVLAHTVNSIPATQARLGSPFGVAVAPDGSLHISDFDFSRVFRVDPSGILTTFAGGGQSLGDGGLATLARIGSPRDIALGPDGSLYVADAGFFRVRRIDPSGIITTVAGTGQECFPLTLPCGDGGQATQADLASLQGIAVGADGSLFIGMLWRIRRVGPDGIITTVAGTGQQCLSFGACGDGGPATRAQLEVFSGVAVGEDGSLYIGDARLARIRRVVSPLPGFSVNDILVAAEDGSEVYVFNNQGLHLRTLDALTGAVRFQFGYDANVRLVSITDIDGNVTTIQRDASGKPTAIAGPFGQLTSLTLDANGYLASISNPAAESHQMSYSGDGLLTSFTNPRGNVSVASYDTLGRVTQATDAATGFQNLARATLIDGYDVTRTTALKRVTHYQVTATAAGDELRTNQFSDGTQASQLTKKDGTITQTLADGTISTVEQGPDPRFGMLVSLPQKWTLQTPGGLTRTATLSRTTSLANSSNPFSLISETDTMTINGRNYSIVYDAATRTLTGTTPAGRQRVRSFDAQRRLVGFTQPGITPTQFSYDTQGRVTSVTRGTRVSTLTYNSQGYLASLMDPLAQTVGFARDAVGRPTTVSQADGSHVDFAYDPGGNLVSLTTPNGSSHLFGYTPVDLLQSYSPPPVAGSGDTQYAYNLDRQPLQLTHPNGIQSFTYDLGGRLQTLTYPQDAVTYGYDAAGRLQTISTAAGVGLGHSYHCPVFFQ